MHRVPARTRKFHVIQIQGESGRKDYWPHDRRNLTLIRYTLIRSVVRSRSKQVMRPTTYHHWWLASTISTRMFLFLLEMHIILSPPPFMKLHGRTEIFRSGFTDPASNLPGFARGLAWVFCKVERQLTDTAPGGCHGRFWQERMHGRSCVSPRPTLCGPSHAVHLTEPCVACCMNVCPLPTTGSDTYRALLRYGSPIVTLVSTKFVSVAVVSFLSEFQEPTKVRNFFEYKSRVGQHAS